MIFKSRKQRRYVMAKLKYGNVPDSRFDDEQLRMGTNVEKEHTDNPELAEEIAKAHLMEDKRYYTKLKRAGL